MGVGGYPLRHFVSPCLPVSRVDGEIVAERYPLQHFGTLFVIPMVPSWSEPGRKFGVIVYN